MQNHLSALLVLTGILIASWVIDPTLTTSVVIPIVSAYLASIGLPPRRPHIKGLDASGRRMPPLALTAGRKEMPTQVVIIDITRAHFGTEQALLANVREQLTAPDLQFEVLALANQVAAVGQHGQSSWFHLHSIDALYPDQGVVSWIQDVTASTSTDSRVVVFSFHPRVLGLAREYPGGRITFQPMARFSSGGRPSSAWPHSLIPIDEAVDALSHVLQRAAGRPVRKTDLRGLLAVEDSRLDKDASPASDVSGLISMILEAAEKRGLITTTGTDPEVKVRLSNSSGSIQGAEVPALPAPASGAVPRGVPHVMAADHPSSRVAGEAIQRPKAKAKKKRSGQFIDVLRQSGLGYQRTREALHAHIEELATPTKGMTLAGLIDESVDLTQADFPVETYEWAKEYAWRGLKSSLEAQLTLRPVTLDEDGELIEPDWAGLGRKVVGLSYGWRDDLLGEEILAIARTMNVTVRDVRDLSGALFLNRDPESLVKVGLLVELLKAKHRLEQDASGVLRVVAPLHPVSKAALEVVTDEPVAADEADHADRSSDGREQTA